MKGMCSCRLGRGSGDPGCTLTADAACPLCEQPFCTPCLRDHHVCRDQPQHIAIPARKVDEVRSQ